MDGVMKKKNHIRCWVVQNVDTGEVSAIEKTRDFARIQCKVRNQYYAGDYEIIRCKVIEDPLPKKVKPADCTRCDMFNPTNKKCGAYTTPNKCIGRFVD